MVKRNIVIDVTKEERTNEFIGYVGEHLSTILQYVLPYDLQNECTYLLTFKLPDGNTQYAKIDNYPITFAVPQALTQKSGILMIQLTVYKDKKIIKSYLSKFTILDSLQATEEVNDKYVGLLDESIMMFDKLILDSASDYIYFKKECENWSNPRIYFFRSQEYSKGTEYDIAWEWGDSPYMLQNDDGYYYYPIIKGYDNVIFFCDKKSDGINYQTSDLKIPCSTWYNTPLFVQSEIGYDGFWADYMTKTTKLLIQLNAHYNVGWYKGLSVEASYTSADGVFKKSKVYDLGLIINGSEPYDTANSMRNPYKYIELPIDFKNVELTFSEHNEEYGDSSKTENFERYLACYNQPVAYLDAVRLSRDYSVQGVLKFFNAYIDRYLKEKLDSDISLLPLDTSLFRIEQFRDRIDNLELGLYNIESQVNDLIERGSQPILDAIEHFVDLSDDECISYGEQSIYYTTLGNMIYMFGTVELTPHLEDGHGFNNFLIRLPYVSKVDKYIPILISGPEGHGCCYPFIVLGHITGCWLDVRSAYYYPNDGSWDIRELFRDCNNQTFKLAFDFTYIA